MADDPLPLELSLACSRFSRLAARRADVGVSSVGWRIASALDHRGPLRLSEIADHERVSRPTATTAVKRLEEHGILTRTQDPHDSRSWFVDLTPHGRAQLATWRERLGAGVGELLADVSPAERETLREAAGILRRLAEAGDDAPRAASRGT